MKVFSILNKITSKGTGSVETYIKSLGEYYELLIFLKISRVLTKLVRSLILGSVIFLGVVFITISGVFFLGDYLNSYALSCLIVGLFFFVVIVPIILLLRKKIDSAVLKDLSNDILKD